MDAETLNQVAASLALCAVKGERADLEKIAAEYQKQAVIDMEAIKGYLANPYVRNSLIGMGAGGLIGAMQPKRKGRNALTYGLIGGLGGLGSAALLNHFNQQPATAPPAAGGPPPAAGGSAPAAGDAAVKTPLEQATAARDQARADFKANSKNPYVYAAGGGALGAVAGGGTGRVLGESAGDLLSRGLGRFRSRGGELDALLNANGASPGSNAVAQGLRQVQERFRRAPGNAGNVAAFAEDLATSPNAGVQEAVRRNLGNAAVTPTQTQQAAAQLGRNVERIVNRGRLPIFGRTQAARQLSQMQDLLTAQQRAVNPPRRGAGLPPTATALGEQDVLRALSEVRTRNPVMSRFLPRVGGVAGGLAGGIGGGIAGFRAGGGYADYANDPLYKALEETQKAYQAAGGK